MLITDTEHTSGMGQFKGNKVTSMMLVPMIEDAVLIGIVCVVNNRHLGVFAPEQFSRLRSICPQVVISYKMYRSYKDSKEQQRLSQEVEFARQLQASLLPEEFPDTYPFHIHAHTRSSKEVSGDFYDFIMIDENRLLVVIADACGKGIPACMLMAMTRSFIRSLVEHFTTVEALMMELNKNLYRDTDEERFVTLACCLLDRRNSLIEYARAGHTELITFVHGHIRKIYPDGTALGIFPCEMSKYDSICLCFAEGMGLLLFTDGITEVINSKGEEFGVARLQEEFKKSLLNGDEPEATIDNILDAVDKFSADPDTFVDDQTMVIIKHSIAPDNDDFDDSEQV
jgi:sigma-B regulation protein RsbU (phosphoserine phosphatase)